MSCSIPLVLLLHWLQTAAAGCEEDEALAAAAAVRARFLGAMVAKFGVTKTEPEAIYENSAGSDHGMVGRRGN